MKLFFLVAFLPFSSPFAVSANFHVGFVTVKMLDAIAKRGRIIKKSARHKKTYLDLNIFI